MSDDGGDAGEVPRWRPSLRTEHNVIRMPTSAAMPLLDHGAEPQRAREHLARADAACRRCRELLKDWPDQA